MDTRGEKEKMTSKKNVYGRSTSCHESKKFRTRSMEKQGGIVFGFRKTETAFIKPGRQTFVAGFPDDRQLQVFQIIRPA
jgi:hypothetical protein